MWITADDAPAFQAVQKIGSLITQPFRAADPQPASGNFNGCNPGQGFIQAIIFMQSNDHGADRQITQDVILPPQVEVIY